ncbi:hypothetical protein FRC03_005991 [Tulasnella sp. 419]|nr:hypothetical protein FRC02_004776 [Tulasnella sp. 418]KAG8960926.1 hypothetical protein FRC03_005991 [Tulasnella sp. 419]
MSSPWSFTLYDLSGDLKENEFRDENNKIAYLIRPFEDAPDAIEITRQQDWGIALEHEPWRCALAFGRNNSLGRVWRGTRQSIHHPIPMAEMLRRAPADPSSRMFRGMDGQDYFWKQASRRLECRDQNDGLLAVYEYLLDDVSFAKLQVKPLGWSMTTEIILTLILNRHALRYGL